MNTYWLGIRGIVSVFFLRYNYYPEAKPRAIVVSKKNLICYKYPVSVLVYPIVKRHKVFAIIANKLKLNLPAS